MRIYKVGGALRDALLSRPVADRDYVVLHADEQALRARFPGLKRVGGGPRGAQGLDDVTEKVFLLGDEQYTLSPAADIQQDLLSRDLTINALARECRPDTIRSRLEAHPQALDDLRLRLLRPVSVANFGHDPCRAMRAARFAAVLPGFAAVPELFSAMRHAMSQGLGDVAPERVAQELRKACGGGAPARFLAFLAYAGCLNPWFAPFAESHALRLRAQQLMQRLANGPGLWVWMAMCQPLTPEAASRMASRLRLPKLWQKAGAEAPLLVPLLRDYRNLAPEQKVRLLLQCHRQRLLPAFCALAEACYGAACSGLRTQLEADLLRVLDVRLPEHERDKGAASGIALRRLQAAALQGEESGVGKLAQAPEQHESEHEEKDQ